MSFLKSIGNTFLGTGGDVYNGIGSALNKLTGAEAMTDKTYKQQMSAMNAQNAYNTYMWNLANQYNTPQAQLARMAEAGIDINPTSYALGTGNLSNTASVVSSDSGFAGSGSPAGNPISMAMGVAQGVQGIRESKARIANMKEQNTNLMEQGNILFNQMEGSRLSNETTRKNLEALSHNITLAKEQHKPVGYAPTIHGDPIGYTGNIIGQYAKGMMGY